MVTFAARAIQSYRLLMGRRGRRSSVALAGQRQWCGGNGDGGNCWLENITRTKHTHAHTHTHITHTTHTQHTHAHASDMVCTRRGNIRQYRAYVRMMYVMRRSEARGRPCALEQSVLDHAVVWSSLCVRWFVRGWSRS